MNDQDTLSAKEPAEIDRTAKIAEQNDHFRKTWVAYFAVPGQIVVTRGVASLSASAQVQIMRAVQTFDTFTEDNDPYRDHTFGALEITSATRHACRATRHACRARHPPPLLYRSRIKHVTTQTIITAATD
jgi:hypothetical protein